MYIHDHSYMHARVSVSVLVYEGLDEVWACAGFGADVFGRLQQAACLAGRSLGEKPEPRAFHITPSKNPPPAPKHQSAGSSRISTYFTCVCLLEALEKQLQEAFPRVRHAKGLLGL